MEPIDSIEDSMRGVVTYELKNGQRVQIDARAVREVGAAAILREYGYGEMLPTERVSVSQSGRVIGSVPPDFYPLAIRSSSFLYDPRPGDFVRDGDQWRASSNLGPGDFDMIPGFERIDPS